MDAKMFSPPMAPCQILCVLGAAWLLVKGFLLRYPTWCIDLFPCWTEVLCLTG